MRTDKIDIYSDSSCAWADINGFSIYGRDRAELLKALGAIGLQVTSAPSDAGTTSHKWFPKREDGK